MTSYLFFGNLLITSFSDLKCDNILLDLRGRVHLIDFGNARCVKDGDMVLPRQNCYFEAPEVFKGEPAGLACDWWSFGVVVTWMLQGSAPFSSSNADVNARKKEIREAAAKDDPDISGITDEHAKDFVLQLLTKDPARRLSFVYKHPFLYQIPKLPTFFPEPIIPDSSKPYQVKNDVMVDEGYSILYNSLMIPSMKYLDTLR